MAHKVRTILLFFAFCFVMEHVLAQEIYPPPPDDVYMTHETGPCGDELEHDTTNELPPPGLCMPINDYLIPLLIAGILLGSYKIYRIEAVK